ncbi:hypothetical protein ACH4SK_04925 [Streptomyces inhibens]|uniref:hypothetical protein n=1 Tax=Streptomyces inhibens TaxID=2293571 RepID=UPI0037969C18
MAARSQVQELIASFKPYLLAPDVTFYLASSDRSLKERMEAKTDVKQDDTDLFSVSGRLARLRANFEVLAEEDPSAVTLPTDGARTSWPTSSSSTWRRGVLNPIDVDAVIRDGRVAGTFPGEIHEGVAWWVAACFVVVSRASRIAVAHDGHPSSTVFHRRFCRGAINAQHFGCQVADLGEADEAQLVHAMKALGGVPGGLLSTTGDNDQQTVTIRLYDAESQPLTEDTGLAKVREMIATDRVPIPVNDQAKGRITARRDLVETA